MNTEAAAVDASMVSGPVQEVQDVSVYGCQGWPSQLQQLRKAKTSTCHSSGKDGDEHCSENGSSSSSRGCIYGLWLGARSARRECVWLSRVAITIATIEKGKNLHMPFIRQRWVSDRNSCGRMLGMRICIASLDTTPGQSLGWAFGV